MANFRNTTECILLILSIFLTVLADNPIITQKYTADPNAIVYNGRVYVYCSHDDNNPDDGFNIIDYTLVSSDDMANWTDHGEVFKVPRDASWARQAYAPGAAVKNNKIYLYIPDGGSQIGVAVADRPEGPFTDPIKRALITKSMPNCNVEWLFDPAAFVDTDGQAYLYFGGGGSTPGVNLRVIKLNSDMISTSGTAVTINAPRSFEASYMHKYKDTYFFSYSNDFKGPPNAQIAYMTGNNPMTGFTHKGAVLDNPTLNGTNINMGNNNHASIVEYKDKWYIFYHDRRLSNQVYKRSVSVDYATYNSDGTLMNKTTVTTGVQQIKYLNPYDTIQAETINRQSGIKTDICSEGGIMVTSISADDYIRIKGVDFGNGASNFEVRAASGSTGGSIELRLGSQTGTLIGTCTISATGGWTTWKNFKCDISNASGVKDLYLVFKGTGEPFRLNWYKFSNASGYQLSIETVGKGTVSRSPDSSGYSKGKVVTLTAHPDTGWVFNSWSGSGISSIQNPLSITMDTSKTVTALFIRSTADGNLVVNGDFSAVTNDWKLNVWSGAATGNFANGEYKLTIDSIGANSYDIQLIQPGIFLEKGKTYQVCFDAYATSNRELEVNVEMDDDPWTSYLKESKQFNLTSAKQTFKFEFAMEKETDVNGRIAFNAGTAVSAVTIDNISVKVYTPTAVSPGVLSEKISSDLKVNVSNSSLNVLFTATHSGTTCLNIYNLKGEIVKATAFATKSGSVYSHTISLSTIPNGYYVLRVINNKKSVCMVKQFFVNK